VESSWLLYTSHQPVHLHGLVFVKNILIVSIDQGVFTTQISNYHANKELKI
jgi:hypothetical protein